LASANANAFVGKVRTYVGEHHDTEAVVISARIESELVDLSPGEQIAYDG
jgi:ribosome-binding ATPase YchF (GTP1/OBG family)